MKKTLAAIEAEIARLKGMADKIYKDEVAGVIERMRTAIDHYGLTAADLGFGAGAGARKTKGSASGAATKTGLIAGVAKYRDPATGKTWTGRGKPPAWIAGVANRDAFLIDGAGGVIVGNGAAAPAGKRKSPVKSATIGVAKYQDPASGKTWTGRGKPPAWIAGAANRDAFLIGAPRAEASGIELTGSPAAAESAPAGKRKGGSAKAKGRAAAKKAGGRRKAATESQAAQ
jgi:DNA-binding protein H-NS